MSIVDLGGVIEVSVIARCGDLLVGQDRVDRVDHIVGRQLVAVVEGDIWTQHEFERRLVHPLERLGDQWLELKGLRIAIDQRIPDLMPEHDAGAQLIVVRRDVGHRVAPGDAQRVGRFLRDGRRGAKQCRCQNRPGHGAPAHDLREAPCGGTSNPSGDRRVEVAAVENKIVADDEADLRGAQKGARVAELGGIADATGVGVFRPLLHQFVDWPIG